MPHIGIGAKGEEKLLGHQRSLHRFSGRGGRAGALGAAI
jgi:hypothetical protein